VNSEEKTMAKSVRVPGDVPNPAIGGTSQALALPPNTAARPYRMLAPARVIVVNASSVGQIQVTADVVRANGKGQSIVKISRVGE
jgi:hypothetical protein